MNAIKRIGLVVLAVLVAYPALADARERRHERDRGGAYSEPEHRGHRGGDRRSGGRQWRHHDDRTFRGRGRERGQWSHRERRYDRGHRHGYRPHHRPRLFFGDRFGRFHFRLFD